MTSKQIELDDLGLNLGKIILFASFYSISDNQFLLSSGFEEYQIDYKIMHNWDFLFQFI